MPSDPLTREALLAELADLRRQLGALPRPGRAPAAPPVLLVDDNVRNLLTLEAVLEPLGVRIVRAATGADALEALLREDFAVIVMDVQMPVMDGFETAALIRSRERTRGVPILFVSAVHRDELHRRQGYALGAVDYIEKPFDADALRAKVAALVDIWRRAEVVREREAALFERERAELLARGRESQAEAESLTLKLAQSESRFRRMFESEMIGFAFTDRRDGGVIVDANDYFLRLLGYSREDLARGAVTWNAVSPPETKLVNAEMSKQLAVAGLAGPNECEYFRADGARVPVLLGVARLPPDAGAEFVTFALDATERRRLERERENLLAIARSGEEQFRTLGDGIPALAWYAEPDGSIVWYNRRWLEYTGAAPGEHNGWNWRPALHPDDIPASTAKWLHSIATGEPLEDQFRILGRDGNYRWFLTRAVAQRDAAGRVVRWYGTNVDIDDQKRAEQAFSFLAEASSALAGSLDLDVTLRSIADLIVPAIADSVTVYLHGPEGAARLAYARHRDPDKLALLREVGERYPLPDASPAAAPRAVREGRTRLVADVTPEVLASVARDDRHLAILRALAPRSVIAAPLRAAGRVTGSLVLVASASGRRFGPEDARLADEIANRAAAALESARLYDTARAEQSRAEDANRAKDEFLSVLSHELRTPMTAILGWSSMLVQGAVPETKRARAFEAIDRNARNQAQLIDDLLDFSRIVSGKLRVELAPTSLGAIVEAALDTARPAAEARGVSLRAVVDSSADTVLADAGRLQQVAWNLLSNAVKFTPKGGRVMVVVRRLGSSVELAVEDTGEGIDPAFLPFVFDRFRQFDASSTRAHGGLGLGLSIVKQLVELHGGRVEAQSAGPGKGARFVVRLPVAPVRRSAEPPAPGVPAARDPATLAVSLDCPPELVGVRVLAVDDEPDARDLVASVLEHCGARVVTAGSAAEAFEKLRTERPDVLVCDVGMPGEDGPSLLGRVRALAREAGGRTPAIALTAFARPEDRTRVLAAGFDLHLAKPVEPQELLAAVASLAGRRPDA